MARKYKKKERIYSVDWYTSSGFCYRTTDGCRWKDVLECRRVARALGESIKYECYDVIEYEYTIS